MSPRMRPSGTAVRRPASLAGLLACVLALAGPGLAAAAAKRSHRHQSPTCPGAHLSQVTVSPLPGTPEATPQTQISFLGVGPSQLRSVYVIGSRSGRHAGSVRYYSAQAGASFLPEVPFQEGEHVTVCAYVATGKGIRRVASSFSVATPAHLKYQPPFEFPGTRGDAQAYHSVDLKAPAITVNQPAGLQSAPGEILATPYAGPAEHGAMIFESSGQLVWFHRPPNPDWGIANLQVQSWNGHPDLVFWQGLINSFGFGTGEDVILNKAYEQVARIRGGNGLKADLHDIELTPAGAAYITAYYPVRAQVPIPDGGGAQRTGIVLDSAVQEIDVRTGLVMWEWQSLGHVPVSQSRIKAPLEGAPYDYFHVDSLQPLPGGNLLICARNVWGVYSIASHTGQIAWQLGTHHSNLTLGAGVRFAWPEEAQMLPTEQLALYDGGAQSAASPRGEVIDLEWSNNEADLASGGQLQRSFDAPRSAGQGSIQPLAGGSWLVGWGGLPNFTEYDSEGNVIYDAQFPAQEVGYRVYREPWQGQPSAAPNLLANTSGSTATAYVSWDGATDVVAWRLLAGPTPHTLEAVATVPATGFETAIPTQAANDVLAQALNAAGEVIGESRTIAAAHT
jgi:hypothetical protein